MKCLKKKEKRKTVDFNRYDCADADVPTCLPIHLGLFAGLDIAAGIGNNRVLPFDAGSWVQTLTVTGLPLIGLVAHHRGANSRSSSHAISLFAAKAGGEGRNSGAGARRGGGIGASLEDGRGLGRGHGPTTTTTMMTMLRRESGDRQLGDRPGAFGNAEEAEVEVEEGAEEMAKKKNKVRDSGEEGEGEGEGEETEMGYYESSSGHTSLDPERGGRGSSTGRHVRTDYMVTVEEGRSSGESAWRRRDEIL